MFFAGVVFQPFQSLFATALLTLVIVLGIFMTLLISKLLSKTLLKGIPSSFALELPPYRKPQIGKVIVRSIVDRTLFVLGRAIAVAAPAGLIIWLFANIHIGGASVLSYCVAFLDPFGRFIGVDGYIIMAFILGLPANEIVIPLLIMSYISSGSMVEAGSLLELKDLLISHGWTWLTALCTMLLCLMHFPCGTTLWTIKKETGSFKWTFLSFLIPTLCGIAVCAVIAQLSRLLGLV